MARFRKSTIKDVASRSGVSTTTVSNFVSGHKNVCSPETAARIEEAIAALHYTPSSLTRGLHQRASSTIGVCLPHPLDADVFFGFFFLERLWRGIMEQADHADYALLHYPRSVRDGSGSSVFLDGRVDGVLLREDDHERATQLAEAGMPTVLLTQSLRIPEGCAAAWADDAQTSRLALEHLWNLGHRRIAHVAGPVGTRANDQTASNSTAYIGGSDIALLRLNGYCAWMREHQAYDPALIAYAQAWTAPCAGEYLQAWRALENPPTAIYCANDAQALAVLEAARELGWRVPEAFSVVGVDNSHEARDCEPALTSVEVPMEVVGQEAMCAVTDLISGYPVEQCRRIVPVTTLVVRQSTAQLGNKE